MSTSANGGRPSAGGPEGAHDSDAGLQEELRREAAEHAALGGDTATNRNLTGSTTWVTLGEAADASAVDQTRRAGRPRRAQYAVTTRPGRLGRRTGGTG